MQDKAFDDLLREAVIEFVDRKYVQTMPPINELEEIVKPSARFKRRMAKMIENPKKYLRDLRRPMHLRILRKVAVVIIIISMLFGSAMLVPSVRAKVVEIVRSWFDDHTEYNIVSETTAEFPDRIEFGYIPDGYELEFENLGDIQLIHVFQNQYAHRLEILLTSGPSPVCIDNEYSEIYSMKTDTFVVDVYESNDENTPSTALTYDEERKLLIIVKGQVAVDELVSILENCSY